MTVNNEWVDYLKKLPLKDLRRRQNIVKQQQKIATKQKIITAISALGDMDDSLTEAVYLKEF